ncbi:hypothetical protein AAG906_024575 [Vitis piasezkii]
MSSIFNAISMDEFRRIATLPKLQILTSRFEIIRMEDHENFGEFHAKLMEILNFSFNLGIALKAIKEKSLSSKSVDDEKMLEDELTKFNPITVECQMYKLKLILKVGKYLNSLVLSAKCSTSISRMPILLKLFPLNSENISNLLSLDLNLNVLFLDLSLVDLGATIHWSQAINKLPFLVHLNLNSCALLPFTTGSLFHANSSTLFTTLVHLDLSSNDLNGLILDAFGNMISLAYLDLRYCAFEGEILFAFGDMRALEYLDISGHGLHGGIPDAIGDLTSLTYLELFGNQLKSLPNTFGRSLDSIPDTFGNMVSLEELFLSHNEPEGEIPKSFGRRLVILDLSLNRLYGSIPNTVGNMFLISLDFCHWKGTISKAHLFNLSNLGHLGLSSSSLTFNMSLEWVPPFHLGSLLLASCKLGPPFPRWLQTQKHLTEFDLFNSDISDILPDWFWNLTFECQ